MGNDDHHAGNNGLWFTAFLLASVLTVVIGYHWSIVGAAVFWVISTVIMIALRP